MAEEQTGTEEIDTSQALAALQEVDNRERALTPPGYPEHFEVGNQRYTDPRFWRPDNGGVSLADDKHYQRVLAIFAEMEAPHVLAERERRK